MTITFDYDLDGRQDMIMANGHPDDLIEKIASSLRYKQPLLLFHHEGKGFRDVSAASGPRRSTASASPPRISAISAGPR